ncbi:glycoside hydrolase family 2 protein [Aureobasidium subglaciale]|nr:glycoside hydrolase family 2 protein [Aureobasidium subglaciale]KAI5214307.1 glycoside hydrolase family 2 protein [Aureobasidium subglaciale]KAI5216847.1 glycoside hydrolase family 2 protein [Aureobasidium subglaciale]KAI5254710.1 glycoside hydrolase family 2 protein [Aureobasidium subglaciale]
MLFYIAAAITAIASKTIAQSVISLSGHDWTLTNPDLNISCPASLPSQAHLDLHACQVIGSPYYGLNDFNLRWVAWANWTYTSAPISGLNRNLSSTWLVFNGLDTFASISFCGQHVAATNNQFRQYYFDVSSVLESCQSAPVLSVNFGSAPKITQEIADEPGQETWPYGIEIMYEFPNRQFMRKEQNDFGWDWGPAFAPAGPWQPAWVVQLDNPEVYIRNSLIDIFRRGQLNNLPPDQSQPWTVNASLDYIGTVPQSASLRYSLSDLNNTIISSGYLENINITSSTLTGSTEIDPSLVELWWPSGLGPQNLYNMTITLNDGSKSNNTITSITKRTGFRTIVLNENPISQEQLNQGIAPGNNWHFEINGHEFYAKGSNFIPPDPFWPAVTEARMRDLLDAVVEGNQNMLRVWSSGAYLPDWLYDLGDEYGILLWSEFEFGDALYPVDELFLENVREEAEYNVRRVNHHPSLAAWMGGNELENLELANVNNTAPEQYDRYVAEYEKLFLDTLLPVVFGNSRSISYAPSSTSNGWLELNFSNPIPIVERYNNLTEGSVYGETDHYNYDPTVAFNLSSYPIGRFSNEFGYHSMPSLQSWEQVIPQSELYFNSSYVQLRNRHYPPGGLNATNYYNSSLGMGEMTRAAIEWYPVPNKSDSVANFSAWCHTTQIFQADFYRSQIEFYLRGSGLPERQLGSLYWQLEDQWTAPTWAGIEYDGRWKVLHYIAKDAYQPVIIASYYNVTTGDLEVYVTSDLWQAVSGSASFSWYDWSGDCLNISTPTTAEVNVGAINSTRVLSTNTFDILNSAGFNYSNVLMHMETTIQGQMPNSNESRTFTHENWFHASPLSSAALVDPGLQLSFSNTTKNFSITARSGIAAWVWLDYPLGAVVTFDSNGFWLLPNQTREVGYKVKSDSTGGAWIDDVTVESLYDNTIS